MVGKELIVTPLPTHTAAPYACTCVLNKEGTTRIQEVLNRSIDDPHCIRISFCYTIPCTVDRTLLRDAFILATSVRLRTQSKHAIDALCGALASDYCLTRSIWAFLVTDRARQKQLARALTINTSLRLIYISDNSYGPFVEVCSENTSIETVVVFSNVRVDVARLMRLPSLIRIMFRATVIPEYVLVQLVAEWPHMVVRARPSGHVVLKTPVVMGTTMRQYLRALYECAARVLPDHVIKDIADEMMSDTS